MSHRLIAPALVVGFCLLASSASTRADEAQGLAEGQRLVASTLAGTAAAGPMGFVLGALSGALLVKPKRPTDSTDLSLALAYRQQGQLEESLVEVQDRLHEEHRMIGQALAFEVMFAPGDDRLSELDRARVHTLANYLQRRPELAVEIDGYADPRGSDEYNHVLSLERARAIAHALEILGVESERIQLRGHGADLSRAPKGDLIAYAHERRAEITILAPHGQALAQGAL